MIDITRHQELIVRQIVERLEAFTGIETQNRYGVLTSEGEQLLYAYEESGFFSRMFLKSHRPLTITVVDNDGNFALSANRGFFWINSHMYMQDESEQAIGSLHRQFVLIGRKFRLLDATGNQVAEIRGQGFFRPNTFRIYDLAGEEIARITKQWGGVMREMFSDADTFHVEYYDNSLSQDIRTLILATAFSIDLDFFESSNGGINAMPG